MAFHHFSTLDHRAMTVLKSVPSALKLILVFSCSFSLFLLYGRRHFYRDPGSAFFDPSRAHELQYSAVRLHQVDDSREHVVLSSGEASRPKLAQGSTPEICATVTTFFRHNLERQYIKDTILSILDRLTAQERGLLHLEIFFTDFNPSIHPSWHQPGLRTLLDGVWSYGDERALVAPELRSWLENMSSTNISTKAIMDYTLALQKCLDRTDAPYIAVFEGDTLFAAGWVAPTLRALRSADELMQQRSSSWWSSTDDAQDWLDMRIFNQERSTGWASREVGGNNELTIILVVDIIVGLAFLLLRSRNILSSNSLDKPTIAVLFLFIIPVCVVSFFQAGKASLLPPRAGLKVENFGCCSQALIFNRKYVPELIKFLRGLAMQEADGKIGHRNYDMRTKDFAFQNGLNRLALYPMQVQHMGIKSAIGTAEAQSVWSMAFEDLKDAGVKARHDEAMDELFGHEWRNT